jgi:hypothetical protein
LQVRRALSRLGVSPSPSVCPAIEGVPAIIVVRNMLRCNKTMPHIKKVYEERRRLSGVRQSVVGEKTQARNEEEP